MNRTELQQLADLRIAEAQELLQLPVTRPDGAYYLAGYAVECALKACIAKQTNRHDFPDKKLASDCHTHNLEQLVKIAGLEAIRRTDSLLRPPLANNWNVVKDWSEIGRYERHTQPKAQKLIEAITDPINGVLPWIKDHW